MTGMKQKSKQGESKLQKPSENKKGLVTIYH